jgi:hypothetical protein
MCPHTTIYVSSYCCACVLILLCMRPHTWRFMCPHTWRSAGAVALVKEAYADICGSMLTYADACSAGAVALVKEAAVQGWGGLELITGCAWQRHTQRMLVVGFQVHIYSSTRTLASRCIRSACSSLASRYHHASIYVSSYTATIYVSSYCCIYVSSYYCICVC